MKNLYICERPYPLFRTVVKAVREAGQHDILLSNHVSGMEKIIQPLHESEIFKNIFFVDDVGYVNFYKYGSIGEFFKFPTGIFKLLKKFFLYRKLQRDAKNLKLPQGLNINAYDEIFVNDAVSSMSLYLFHNKKQVVCVEHAKDVFKKSGRTTSIFDFAFWLTGCLEKIGLCYGLHGTSQYVQAIEVSSGDNLVSLVKHKEIREVDLGKIIDMLSEDEKDKIFDIYKKAYQFEIPYGKKVSVLLTQPLYIDGLVPDETNQIYVYRKIIKEYMNDADLILIKPHPRDFMDYKTLIPNSIIIDPAISAEILNLSNKLCFEKVVTINSTSIYSFVKAKECILLGKEYLD